MKYNPSDSTQEWTYDDIHRSIKKDTNNECLHDTCPECNGTGQKLNGLGYCMHMIACPCPKCSPRC